MEKLKFAVPSLFGLEGLISDEIKKLGYEASAQNGRVFFEGDALAIARTNINLRFGERIQLVVGEFEAGSFDELFEGTKALNWEDYLPENARFPVKGYSLNSKLFSVPDCQSIVKKAVVERLKTRYRRSYFEEGGALYQISFSIMKDRAVLTIDTSGAGLHKRGYRAEGNEAPLRETLAAAMVKLARFKYSDYLLDPFCGSGTILIEAALLATNTAPGINRRFAFEGWENLINKTDFASALAEARDNVRQGNFIVHGRDIERKNVSLSAQNAKKAGVSELVRVTEGDATKLSLEQRGGMVVTNPPFGERMLSKEEARKLYREMGQSFFKLDGFKFFILSSDDEFERHFGRRADKKRKLYNGMIKCDFYQYFK